MKKICKSGLLHKGFLPQLLREKLGVFDFVPPSGSHCVSCLMSTLPEFKHIWCRDPVAGRRGEKEWVRAVRWRLQV